MRNLLDALGGLGECKEGSVHLTLTLTTIFCRCQQTVQLPPVPNPIQLKQITSPKTEKKCFKGNYITTMYFVLCIVCCVSQYCVVPTIKCKKMFQRKLYNNYVFCVLYCLLCCVLYVVYHSTVFKENYITTMYFVLCIVYCAVYCLLCITVLCCANNQMQKMF